MSSMLSLRSSTFQRSVVLADGIAGVFGLGCAIHFDYKRRSDPGYKQKVRENRKAEPNSDVVDVRNKFPKILKLAANFSWSKQCSLLTKALPAAAIRHHDAVKRCAVINACQEDKTPAREDSQIVVLGGYSVSKDVTIQFPKENVA
uniref:Uncharacterized protein n=1 Tax=Ditylenchus dipsaci TaxID=166011 RepID=A0A915CRX5_9BILA